MKDLKAVEVMILDLDTQTVESLEAALARIGITQVRSSGTTVELVQQLENRPADLLFLGDQLPHMPVVETVRALRQLPPTAEIPILWSTHTRNPKALRHQIAAGLAGVIWQPTSETQLRRAVRRALHLEISRDLISTIKLASFFQEFSLDELREVLKESVPCRFAPGEMIVQRGEPSDSFFVLLQGEVEVYLPGGAIAHIPPGHSFGEMGILETDTRSAYCFASKESIVLEIDSRILLHDQDPIHGKIMTKVATLLAARLRMMNDVVRGAEAEEEKAGQILAHQLSIRLRSLAGQIPAEIADSIVGAIIERWGDLPSHLTVISPWADELYAEIFHDLCDKGELPRVTLCSSPDHIREEGAFLIYEEIGAEITQEICRRFPNSQIIAQLRGVGSPTDEPSRLLTAPWNYLQERGHCPLSRENLLLLPDLIGYFSTTAAALFGSVALLSRAETAEPGEHPAILEVVYGVEG